MKLILYTFIFLLTTGAYAQTVSSSCNAPDSVKNKYIDDADYATLQYLEYMSSPLADSAEIPKGMSDTVLRVMVAIYNAAATLPAADSVVKTYNVHNYRASELWDLRVVMDETSNLATQIKNGVKPTGVSAFDDLVSEYELEITYKSPAAGIPQGYNIYLESDSNYNMKGVANKFLMVNDVWYSSKPLIIGDGHWISVNNITDTAVDLTYSFAWGDCPSGCMWRHNWHFRVNSFCDVTFNGSSGDPVVGVGIPVTKYDAIQVYPNPAKDVLYIHGVAEAEYVIHNMKGEQVAKGQTRGKISIEALSPGVYVIGLQQDEKFGIHKLVKE